MAADVLRLLNMQFYAHHGLLPQEEALGQRYAVDLEIHLDTGPAGRADDLALTVDYPALYRIVEDVVVHRRFKLLESLAEHIATEIGQAFPPIDLTVRVRKLHPPVPAHFDGVEVEIRRSYG